MVQFEIQKFYFKLYHLHFWDYYNNNDNNNNKSFIN